MHIKEFDKIGCQENCSKYTKCFICPNCNKLTSFEGYYENYFRMPKDNVKIKVLYPQFHCYCDDCKEYMFECDLYMADSIVKFNKSGYATAFCCEGHYDCGFEEEYSSPYIKFSDDMDEHSWYTITNALQSALLYNKWKEYFHINHIEKFIDILQDEHPISIMNSDRQIHLNWKLCSIYMAEHEFKQIKFYFCTVINQVAFALYKG